MYAVAPLLVCLSHLLPLSIATKRLHAFLMCIHCFQMFYVSNSRMVYSQFNSVNDTVFRMCVHAFRSNKLTESEEKCVRAATGKAIKNAMRVGQRFLEQQAALQQKMVRIVFHVRSTDVIMSHM